jgi:hypothetical protein
MTMSEYEDRFRPPAPSLHRTFAEVRRFGVGIVLQRSAKARL